MAVVWVVAPCTVVEVYRRFRGACYIHHQGDQAASTSETSVNIHQTTWRNNPEDSHRENLKSHLFSTRLLFKTQTTGQFRKKVTLSHVYNEVTSEPTITRCASTGRKALKVLICYLTNT
jgi:hypothetical protein